jgi:hypothetical protein
MTDEDLDLHTIVIVLPLVLDHHFLEDHHQPVPEPRTVDVPEALNAVIIVLRQVQAHQIGDAGHLLLQHEIQRDHPKELLETRLGVLQPRFIPNECT